MENITSEKKNENCFTHWKLEYGNLEAVERGCFSVEKLAIDKGNRKLLKMFEVCYSVEKVVMNVQKMRDLEKSIQLLISLTDENCDNRFKK